MIATSGFLATLECVKFVFGRGSPSRTLLEAQRSPRPSWFNGDPTFKGKGGKEMDGRDFDFAVYKAEH